MHSSAWKTNSANLASNEFSELRLQLIQPAGRHFEAVFLYGDGHEPFDIRLLGRRQRGWAPLANASYRPSAGHETVLPLWACWQGGPEALANRRPTLFAERHHVARRGALAA